MIRIPLRAWPGTRERPLEERLDSHRQRLRILEMQCAAGDFFICASERQRMLWLGWLEAAGRVNPLTYDADPTLRALIDTVPTGVPAEPPQQTRPLVRGVVPGIGQDDPLLVWGGGVWNWLDPLTLIEAVERLVRQASHACGSIFPAPGIPTRRSCRIWRCARRLSICARNGG